MGQELQIFDNQEFGQIRMVELNGKPYAIANDVAVALGYLRPADAVTAHCKGSAKYRVPTKGGEQEVKIIPEGDIYRLVMKSKLPNAEKFESWVCDEVLPSIRKHGAYMTEDTIEKALTSPDFLIQLATKLKEEQTARQLAEKKLEEQKPLVTFAETCVKSKDNILVRELAKVATDEHINIGEKRLYTLLRKWGLILQGSTEPSQYAQDREWFKVDERPVDTPYGVKLTKTTKVTPKGQVYIIERLKKESINN